MWPNKWLYFLKYEYDICKDDNARALYFYKMSGCLNDEMMEQVAKLTSEITVSIEIPEEDID